MQSSPPLADAETDLTGQSQRQRPATGSASAASKAVGEASREANDTHQVRAVPTAAAIRVDGRLDEVVWSGPPAASGFVQAEPREGQPATEATDVWVSFDERNLYIAARLRDSDPGGVTVNDIRKDFNDRTQDAFSVILDTFHDRRNGYVFMTNPEGARGDRQVAGEGREINVSWDAIWRVETQRTAEGWTLEMEIPFRALRFDPGKSADWGINFSRSLRRNNEVDYWAPVPRAYSLNRLSLAGDLVGLPSARGGRDLRVKPFVLGGTVRETGGDDFASQSEVGVDVKYGLTSGLTLDVTANPDFAQVEADEQRVNLTQFSLFFQEKREFFLENSGLFYVGDAARNTRVSLTPRPDEDLLLFFSRRIGLSGGQPLPIRGGVRLTGQAAGLVIGGLAIRTGEGDGTPANDFTVLRLRKNVLASSDVGGIFMMRDAVDSPGDYNRVYGLDSYIRFPSQVDWSTYVVRTDTPGFSDGQYAFRTSINREGNFHHIKFGMMQLGENFRADLGFFRRTGVRKWFIDWGIRPRPEAMRARGVREMHPHIVWNYYEDLDGRLVAKRLHTGLTFFMNDGGFWELSVNPRAERIETDFGIDSRIDPVPAGGYSWVEYQIRGSSDASRMVSGGFTAIAGGLWNGTQRTIRASFTLKPSYRLRGTVSVQRTSAELDRPDAEFVKTFWTGRANYSFNKNMFVDALVQYDPATKQFNSNVRFNVIHHPLSDVFIVWNEQRFITEDAIRPGRSLTIKVTQMVAF